MADDPLEEPGRSGPGPHGCRGGGACDGSGWIFVSRNYAMAHAKPLTADQLSLIEDPAILVVAEIRAAARMTAAENTVYPCKACNTGAFYIWAGGHYDPDHDPAGCAECRDRLGTKAARRESRKAHPAPETRRDLA